MVERVVEVEGIGLVDDQLAESLDNGRVHARSLQLPTSGSSAPPAENRHRRPSGEGRISRPDGRHLATEMRISELHPWAVRNLPGCPVRQPAAPRVAAAHARPGPETACQRPLAGRGAAAGRADGARHPPAMPVDRRTFRRTGPSVLARRSHKIYFHNFVQIRTDTPQPVRLPTDNWQKAAMRRGPPRPPRASAGTGPCPGPRGRGAVGAGDVVSALTNATRHGEGG
ncbi:Uncharacterised protein [Mycobacterium tuberculosis]|nr:Uncharacterised protein [Mycobacterium tuberculosis]